MKTERPTRAGCAAPGHRIGDKKLSEPVTLLAAIEAEQQEAALRDRCLRTDGHSLTLCARAGSSRSTRTRRRLAAAKR